MKAKIHPQYFENLQIICACGNIILAGSTKKELHTELCSACHPFYTGKQKLIDTAGRVDKYLEKVKKTKELKEKKDEPKAENEEGTAKKTTKKTTTKKGAKAKK